MKKIIQKSIIACSIEELFKFHLDSNNIKKITPQNIEVELLNDDGFTYEGKIVKLKTKIFFIPTYWEVKIEKVIVNHLLVDIALQSPFKYWRHQHVFKEKGEVCELKDIIEYQLPFGILGKLVEPFIKKDIKSMFFYRHEKTKQLLEAKSFN